MKEAFKEGYSFEKTVSYTEQELIKMAKYCGDMNFVHHDAADAKQTRFQSIIASGSAITAIFTALIPTHYSEISPMLGLEMSLKFPAPIFPDQLITMSWQVKGSQFASNGDQILSLAGKIQDKHGQDLVLAETKILLLENL